MDAGIGAGHDAGVDLAADFHVYGVDWGAAEITWRLDGAPYRTLRRDDVPPETWVFDRAMDLLINRAVGGDWPGQANDDPELPATMLVDWVRVAEIRA